ncbi:MAG: FAD-dependent oxidoreductase [Bacillota bacterium]
MGHKVQVVVIGGGATGAGILWDLTLRGIESLLVERDDLATGTSGRFHGLLHSGARYVVNDIHSAAECIQENKILREIAPHCIEDTGGVFVATTDDDFGYIEKWLAGCQKAGIQAEEISSGELLSLEPALTGDITKAFNVPDAAVDGFKLVTANAVSAQKKGAKVKTYTEIINFKIENDKVQGVYLKNKFSQREEFVECDFVINATGAWVGQVAALAGQDINVSPDKGVLVVVNHRITKRIINHLRPPGNGDIFVPHGTVTIFGTTSRPTFDPDDSEVFLDEVLELLNEGTKLVPELKEMRIIRAFAGTRPLYEPDGMAKGRQATREFFLIDHKEAGLDGLVSVVGGKLTTYRLMAKAAVDFVANKLGVDKPCCTHIEKLINPLTTKKLGYGPYICQCELVNKEMLDQAVMGKEHFILSDVGRLTRLGLGPCQGIFCNLRAAGYYHQARKLEISEANKLLKDRVQERWKGNRAVLWGEQIKEVELSRAVYLGLLNLEHLDNDDYEL